MTNHAPSTPEEATLDGEGNLVAASARLRALNEAAGGRINAPLAIPALATLAGTVAVLRLPLARTVVAAGSTSDLELDVEAAPRDGGVVLTVNGWRPRPPRNSWLVAQPALAPPSVVLGWTWQTDAALRVTAIELVPGDELQGADIIGQSLTRLVRLIEDDDGDLPLLAGLAAGEAVDGQRAVRRDRPDVELILTASPRHDADGGFTGFDGKARSAAAPEELPVTTAPDFAERLAGAFRGPIDRIIARADSIGARTEGPLRGDYADYAGDIARAGRHLLALVDDLADLQAVEAPDFALPVEPVDLADVARRAAGLLTVRASDKQVRIDRPDADEVLMAHGDFRRVLQILVNLLSNAVRYTPSGGMVWLRTESDADSAVIVVADQGKGIASEDHERVFAKFERVDPSEPGGTGLGLYISRRLARAMGGDITLDSAPGQGARFVLTLPVA